MQELFKKVASGQELSRQDALQLLSIKTNSMDYYTLLGLSNAEARQRFNNRGHIFAQIGIEASPCPANCAFCSLAADVFDEKDSFLLPVETAEKMTDKLVSNKVDEIFLMTTANYSQDEFLKYADKIAKHIPKNMRFVANVGDFDLEHAKKLKNLGFTGVYHICRLGEGIDTQVSVEQRIETLDAIKCAGLELYYCVEPIGPEQIGRAHV